MRLSIIRKYIMLCLCALTCCATLAQKANNEQKKWTIDAEDSQSKVTWQDGTADIVATRGLTLWFNERMTGNTTIEYEAEIVGGVDQQGKKSRISDLNCFWMADWPNGANKANQFGKFENNYALQLYYMSFGGNGNTTTRFRRYTGDERGVADVNYRPRILREYTDAQHLLKADHWYKIRLEVKDGHVGYWIDGEQLVDYVDLQPLTSGYFGFRTTQSHARLRNFHFTRTDPDQQPIVLRWVGGPGTNGQDGQNGATCIAGMASHAGQSGPVTFGVPFAKGEVTNQQFTLKTNKNEALPYDTWTLAHWPDGSIKWQAFCTIVPAGTDSCLLTKTTGKSSKSSKTRKASKTSLASNTSNARNTSKTSKARTASNASPTAGPSETGANLLDFSSSAGAFVTLNGQRQPVLSSEVESQGTVRTVRKYTGQNFIIRTYQYAGSNEMKVVHTLLVDSTLNHNGLNELSLHFPVALHGPKYERYIKFDDHTMSVEPLISRRKIDLEKMDTTTRLMLANIAQWDGFRLSQLSANGYSIRKRTTPENCWVGTIEGGRSRGEVTVGDSTSCTSFHLADFWQSFPATLQVDGARRDTAIVTISLHSPEAEPYSFAPYDTVAHHLLAAYEDVQPGMSTAYGMARTSEITILLPSTAEKTHGTAEETSGITGNSGLTGFAGQSASTGNADNAGQSGCSVAPRQLVCTPEYLHRKRAFGIWSLPTVNNSRDSLVETTLSNIMRFYEQEIERNSWYGYWNYGDVMHAYDSSRDEWRYDVGGYAWDNTELGSPSMFWYQFLRTGDPKVFRMARAMTRHCSEVDVYHDGPHAGLGSRHNVVHWGCGAKESRISEAWWNRFMYYLTADERLGDLMHAVVDADTLLYHLDPMRLAQPRNEYPCTAPARLRLGPDWLGYASNWFTEMERFSNTAAPYTQKLFTGMKCIADFPHGFFEGPLALGYYPATGVITNECDSTVMHTNHLMAIMGGFELMNEMHLYFVDTPEAQGFFQRWLEHCRDYKHLAKVITHNSFLVPRLTAYAAWQLGSPELTKEAWDDVLKHVPYLPHISQPWRNNWSGSVTNDNSTWTLDAIFLKEVDSLPASPFVQ